MPFQTSWVEEKIGAALEVNRLAHAYLLTGALLADMEELFYQIAAKLLEVDSIENHPDLHIVRPESKSRRILIEQIRDLEHELHLKPYKAPRKVAGIFAAERMCIGSAEPANAFLKTLEESPENTILFLISDSPQMLLPTIKSRCLHLPIKQAMRSFSDSDLAFAREWVDQRGNPVDVAYRRAVLLTEHWQELKAELQEKSKALLKEAETEEDEKALIAQVESDFIFLRDQTLQLLLNQLWQRQKEGHFSFTDLDMALHAFDDLRSALNKNVDLSLAVERCCLKIARVI